MDIKKYYNRLGEEYLNTYSSEGMKIISQNEIEFVLSNIPMKRNKINVLEIGVGPGRISQEVIKRNINFTRVDVSEKMINICKKKLKYFKSVKLIQCDVSKGLPFKNGTFDFVYAIRVLKYVNEFEYVLSEINRVLKRNGILVFSMPNKYSINSLNIFRKIPYRRISKNELLRILEENGFSVVRIEGGPKLPDFLYDISNKLFLRTILLIEQFLKRLLGLEFSRTFFILTIKIKKVNQYYER